MEVAQCLPPGIWVSLSGSVAEMANDNDGAWTRVLRLGFWFFFMVYYSMSLLFIRGRYPKLYVGWNGFR